MTPNPTHENAAPEIEATFAMACADLGGHLDLAVLSTEEREAFLALQSAFQETLDTFVHAASRKHGRPSEWFIGFVNSMDINAFAKKDDLSYLIGLNRGTVIRMGLLFTSIFTKFPRIMPFRKLQREAVGAAAFTLSLDYIFLHELAHASLGHLDYLKSNGLAQRLREVDAAPAGLQVDLFQTMELQADYFAGTQLAQAIVQPRGRYLNHRKHGHNDLTLFSLAMFAMAGVGHIINEGQRELESFDSKSHPHPEIRFGRFVSGLTSAVDHLKPRSLSLLARATKVAVEGLLIAYDNVGMAEEAFPAMRKSRDAFLDRVDKTGSLEQLTLEWEQFSIFTPRFPNIAD